MGTARDRAEVGPDRGKREKSVRYNIERERERERERESERV